MSYLDAHAPGRARGRRGRPCPCSDRARSRTATSRSDAYVRKDGAAIDLELYGSVVRDADGNPADAMIVVVDVTARKRWERELAAAKLSAERAKGTAEEASRAKDHFLAVLSHELRTPLTPVLTGISLLERDGTLSGDARHYLEVIRRNVQLESRLIDDLLDLTRITRGKVELDKQLTELCTIIERAVEVCRPEIEARRLHFGVDYGTRPYVLYADPARVQQIFWNLLKNAIKFTPPDGWVRVRCRPDDGHVVVEVDDSGVGHRAVRAREHLRRLHPGAALDHAASSAGWGSGWRSAGTWPRCTEAASTRTAKGPGKGASFRVRLPIVSYGAEKTRPARRAGLSAGRSPPARACASCWWRTTATPRTPWSPCWSWRATTSRPPPDVAAALATHGARALRSADQRPRAAGSQRARPGARAAIPRRRAAGDRAQRLRAGERHRAEPGRRIRRPPGQAGRAPAAARGHGDRAAAKVGATVGASAKPVRSSSTPSGETTGGGRKR